MSFKPVTFEKQETIDIAERVGQVTEGTFVRAREIPFGTRDDGKPDIRTIVDMTGDLGAVSFWAPTSVKMSLPQIPEGAKFRLTFLGKQKNAKTGRTFKAFNIEVDTDGASTEVPF